MVAHQAQQKAGGKIGQIKQEKNGKMGNRERRNGGNDGRGGHVAIQMNAGNGGERAQRRPKMVMLRREKPRQEICAPLKWACFLMNFFIFLASVGCLALGLYLFVNDPRPVAELADFFLNPAVLLASVGLISGVVSLFGLFGALRDNIFLLKLFALCVFIAYLILVVCTCLLFLLFYSDATGDSKGISAQSLLLYSISRYHANKNVADFIDYLQEQLECCGSTTFRDWHYSEQFNCNSTNPYPERCGVPFSCCRRTVAGSAGGGQNNHPLTPAIRSIKCWQNAQNKREQELDSEIYVAGCLQPLRALFDAHAVHIGIAVVSVILPVCLGVCLSQCLARQIDYQHFLLRREQRRIERRERRERRYKEHQSEQKGPQRKKNSISSQSELMERGELPTQIHAQQMGQRAHNKRRSPPKIPPPPTPRNEAEASAIAAAIKASKLEWEKEERRRQQIRAASFSPLRNIALRKEKDCGKNENKRKSMTLEVGEQKKIEKKKKQGGKGEKRKSAMLIEESPPKVQKQQKRRSQLLLNAGPSKNLEGAQKNIGDRAEPSAPPIFLTLQQHHFS